MSTVHMIVGSAVVVAYVAVLICYMRGLQGRPVAFIRQLSMGAAALILVQYALGFSLLGSSDSKPNALHYVFGLATILTVGFEHGVAGQEEDPAKRNRLGMLAAMGTLILALAAYAIGESTS